MKHETVTPAYMCRVYLHQAKSRRGSTFHAVLLQWAANNRRRYAASLVKVQPDLFGGSNV